MAGTAELTRKRNEDAILAYEQYSYQALEVEVQHRIDHHLETRLDGWDKEPDLNARSALFEELTAKAHLSRIEFEGDVDDINRRTLQRLLNGWSDDLPVWEQKRRFYEIVNELLIEQVWADIQAGRLPEDMMVLEISDYEPSAPEKEAVALGYGVLNHKGMVRGTHFEQDGNGVWHRVIEQISRSNSADGSSAQLIGMVGGLEYEPSTDQPTLARPLLLSRKYFTDGVVDVQRALDSFAGPNVRYGEANPEGLPEYHELRLVSHEREARLGHQSSRLADFERRLNEVYLRGGMTYNQKLFSYKRERTKIVNEILLVEPGYAKDARGELSAKYYGKASLAMAAGNDTLGRQHFESALRSADPKAGAVCGGIGYEQNEPGLNEEGKQMYTNAKNDRRKWQWKEGQCTVKKCPTKPNKVKVGPCEVCRNCQNIFDAGKDPDKIYGQAGENTDQEQKPETEWQKINRESREKSELVRHERIENEKRKSELARLAEIERQQQMRKTA